jgi:methylmalonyl-CoA mutase C-terminal domain/subunit
MLRGMSEPAIRVLIAKPGLDGHDRGAKVIVKALRDAGMEVIYTGRHQRIEAIASMAVQEDVDVVGLSTLSGAHVDQCERLVSALVAKGMDDVVLMAGGTIWGESVTTLEDQGFLVFPVGSKIPDIVAAIRAGVRRRSAQV